MNSSAKKIKNKDSSMIPAVSPNGLAGIVPGIGIKNKSVNCWEDCELSCEKVKNNIENMNMYFFKLFTISI